MAVDEVLVAPPNHDLEMQQNAYTHRQHKDWWDNAWPLMRYLLRFLLRYCAP